jgi:hypothetical protein
MRGEEVPAALLTPFPLAQFGLAERLDVIFAFDDFDCSRTPKRKSVHRRSSPLPARRTVAEALDFGRSRDFDLDCAAKTRTVIVLLVFHVSYTFFIDECV